MHHKFENRMGVRNLGSFLTDTPNRPLPPKLAKKKAKKKPGDPLLPGRIKSKPRIRQDVDGGSD
jgi:hypothetical protein